MLILLEIPHKNGIILSQTGLKECSNEISPILALMYQMSGDKLMFLRSLKKVKNMMLLNTDWCRLHASAAKP